MNRTFVRGFCPHCGQSYYAPGQFAGVDIRCEHCQKWFIAGGAGWWFARWILEPFAVIFFLGLLFISWLVFFGGWAVILAKTVFGDYWPMGLGAVVISAVAYLLWRRLSAARPKEPSVGIPTEEEIEETKRLQDEADGELLREMYSGRYGLPNGAQCMADLLENDNSEAAKELKEELERIRRRRASRRV